MRCGRSARFPLCCRSRKGGAPGPDGERREHSCKTLLKVGEILLVTQGGRGHQLESTDPSIWRFQDHLFQIVPVRIKRGHDQDALLFPGRGSGRVRRSFPVRPGSAAPWRAPGRHNSGPPAPFPAAAASSGRHHVLPQKRVSRFRFRILAIPMRPSSFCRTISFITAWSQPLPGKLRSG